MKKLLAIALLAVTLTSSVQAAGYSQSIAAAQWTNLVGVVPGLSAKITAFTLTSASGQAATLSFYDTPTLVSNGTNWAAQVITNAAYAYYTKYATNLVTTWTNYYGYTNSVTNLALVTLSNWQAAASATLPPRLTIIGITNTVVNIDDCNFYFTSGVWVTNTGANAGVITYNVIQ